MVFRFLILITCWLLIDVYVFQSVKSITSNTLFYWIYWVLDILIIVLILYFALSGKFANGPSKYTSWIMGIMMVILVPKIVVLPFLFIDDLLRIIQFLVQHSIRLFSNNNSVIDFASRRKIISQIALGIAAVPFFSTIYGILKGKYDYRVHKVSLYFKDLPSAFNGFKLVQLSDIHAGSFDNRDAVQKGIRLTNAQQGDLFLFTGDLVNNKSEEMYPWIEDFKQLKGKYGSFSILGNHDYGDYIKWENESEKSENLEKLKVVHKKLGYHLMLNETIYIEKEGAKIALIGVENWGKKGFVKHGDLDKAVESVDNNLFKILLSHDPSHWEAVTLNHDKFIHLTLSGHTHGMQFGIEIPGFKWSPSQYIYKQWAGLYKHAEKYIYVNRGFGFLGFPGRVGILPEITVIELRKKS